MRIESLCLVSGIRQTEDGGLMPTSPPIRSFVLGNKLHLRLIHAALRKFETFYLYVRIRFFHGDGGTRLRYETVIEDPQGELIPGSAYTPHEALQTLSRGGTLELAVPVKINVQHAGLYRLRITIRDVRDPGDGILDRKTLTFSVTA